jgi:hypothetical protein
VQRSGPAGDAAPPSVFAKKSASSPSARAHAMLYRFCATRLAALSAPSHSEWGGPRETVGRQAQGSAGRGSADRSAFQCVPEPSSGIRKSRRTAAEVVFHDPRAAHVKSFLQVRWASSTAGDLVAGRAETDVLFRCMGSKILLGVTFERKELRGGRERLVDEGCVHACSNGA